MTVTVGQLNGYYKRVYGKKPIQAVPRSGQILKMVKYKQGDLMLGDSYHVPVILSNENGFTYGGSAGTAYALEAAVPMTTKDATVSPFNYTLRSQMATAAATRAVKAGPAAFGNSVKLLLQNASESCARRMAISVLHGKSPTGIGAAAIGGTTDVSTEVTDMVIREADYAPGIWAGSEGAVVEAYWDNSGTMTKITGAFTVSMIRPSIRTIRLTSVTAGDVTALEARSDTDVVFLFFKGSFDNDMDGMHKVFANKTGIIHGINAGDFGLWAGNTLPAGGQLTFPKTVQLIGEMAGRGLAEDVVCLVSTATYESQNTQFSGLRQTDSSYKSELGKLGIKSLTYVGQTGMIDVVADPMVKNGQAFVFPPEYLMRLGSAEMEWQLPGQDAEPFTVLENNEGFQVRHFSDMTFFCEMPSRCAYIDGIVNPT